MNFRCEKNELIKTSLSQTVWELQAITMCQHYHFLPKEKPAGLLKSPQTLRSMFLLLLCYGGPLSLQADLFSQKPCSSFCLLLSLLLLLLSPWQLFGFLTPTTTKAMTPPVPTNGRKILVNPPPALVQQD